MQARGKHPNSTKKSRLPRNSSATLLCVLLIKHKLQQPLLSYVQLCESAQVWVGQRLHICLRHSYMITGTMHLSFSCTPSVLQQNITGKTSYPLRPQLSVSASEYASDLDVGRTMRGSIHSDYHCTSIINSLGSIKTTTSGKISHNLQH